MLVIYCIILYNIIVHIMCCNIQKEFITGEDHTNIVSDIERNLIGYHNSSVSHTLYSGVHCIILYAQYIPSIVCIHGVVY